MAAILLLDDDAMMRDAVERLLVQAGHTVVAVADGREGLSRLQAAMPDIVITDLLMPRMDGIEAIHAIRKINPTVKIIAMSGGGRARVMDFLPVAARAGADFTLQKPVRRAELLQCVARCLGTVSSDAAK
jgi:two-component system, chemotaxis family, chemotaxis protein CheY